MESEIKKELSSLESELEIKILYAVESGSRAWGFPSTNSDWDVRFIYVHSKDWYLSIDDKKDNYVKILPNDIDLSGWELKKNTQIIQKVKSPIYGMVR
ncbi:MAG: nucleotidyltransferase domain-containing protein [Balneola sp.]